MLVTLQKNTQIVQRYLLNKGYLFNVVELPKRTHTAFDAAAAIGCHVSQIVKSLIFSTVITQKPILILASGANQVNLNIIAKQVNEEVIKADAKFTKLVTGFAIGGVPPVAHAQTIPYQFIDEDLLLHPIVWAAAGTPHAVFSLPSDVLCKLTGGKIINLKTIITQPENKYSK